MSDESILSQLTFFSEDFPARTSAPQGRWQASKRVIAPASGSSSSVLLASYDPATFSLRMYLPLLAMEDRPFLQALPRYGMLRNGELYRLPPLVLPTAENAGSAWPTASASRGGIPYKAHWEGNTLKFPNGKKVTFRLEAAVRWWPTPQERDYRSGTPTDSMRWERKFSLGYSPNLNDTVLWSTNIEPKVSSLNPEWVEALMGYPLDYTNIGGLPDMEANNTIGSLREP